MTYKARIIKDSIAPCGKRLITATLTYPRMIHPELLTHRVLSRNVSSSRAIPVKKLLQSIIEDPAQPVFWGANQAGMQSYVELIGFRLKLSQFLFLQSRWIMICIVWCLMKLNLHKQLANRLLEPWAHVTSIVSATELENFFSLRRTPHAQPEMKKIAELFAIEIENSVPNYLQENEWHLPFVEDHELSKYDIDTLIQLSVARCARVSYLTHDGKRNIEKDIQLAKDLIKDRHLSPTEHQGRAESSQIQSGNFIGFTQYRKTIVGESGT